MNWLPGYLIYAGVLAKAYSGCCAPLYMNIVYKAYTCFTGSAGMHYDTEFRMRTALNPALRWDQMHLALWLQVMPFAR